VAVAVRGWATAGAVAWAPGRSPTSASPHPPPPPPPPPPPRTRPSHPPAAAACAPPPSAAAARCACAARRQRASAAGSSCCAPSHTHRHRINAHCLLLDQYVVRRSTPHSGLGSLLGSCAAPWIAAQPHRAAGPSRVQPSRLPPIARGGDEWMGAPGRLLLRLLDVTRERSLRLRCGLLPLLHAPQLALHLLDPRRQPRLLQRRLLPLRLPPGIDLLASPGELLASPGELSASPSELSASPSELVASPSEL
jgi:hypothetical protein